MLDSLIAACPACGWDNDGRVSAMVAYDTTYRAASVHDVRLFADGFDADMDADGVGYVLCDLRECGACGYDAEPVAEWVGTAAIHRLLRPASVAVAETEAEGLDAIAREEADTQDRARARRTDPGTSHDAASSVRALTAKQIAVRQAFVQFGPMTDEELVARYSESAGIAWPVQSESGLRTRRSELVRRGVLLNTEEKRKMTTGRMAIVWGLA